MMPAAMMPAAMMIVGSTHALTAFPPDRQTITLIRPIDNDNYANGIVQTPPTSTTAISARADEACLIPTIRGIGR